jgi:hypothetical protein
MLAGSKKRELHLASKLQIHQVLIYVPLVKIMMILVVMAQFLNQECVQ